MAEAGKKIAVVFYKNDRGEMPVRDWLMALSPDDRKAIGEDIKTVEFGWPVGMPVAKPLKNSLYEVRSTLGNGTQARVMFTIYKNKNGSAARVYQEAPGNTVKRHSNRHAQDGKVPAGRKGTP